MIKTLRHKFIALAMGSMALVLILLIGGMNYINYRSMLSDTDMRLDIIADNRGRFPLEETTSPDAAPPSAPASDDFSGSSREPEMRNNSDNPSRRASGGFNSFKGSLSAESPYDTRFFTVVLKNDGTTVSVDTGKIAAVSTSQAVELANELAAKNSRKTVGFIDGYRYRIVSISGTNNENNTMYIFLNCERELNSFKNSLISSISVSLLGMLLVFALVVFFSKLMLKPVAESYDKQKQFITDASHELKTPLTIIDANTEVLEMETCENEWTKSIHNQIKRLNSLTRQMVFLSRMDESGSSSFTMLDFPLSDAVEETADAFKAVASSNSKSLTCNIAPDIHICGDEASIRQLVSLLLDNAIKYSDENGKIILTLKASGRNKLLTVWNSCESISVGKHDILFDRFYRADSSRSSKVGGSGIGLSVAKAIVTAHKGKITARSDDGNSIIFSIML